MIILLLSTLLSSVPAAAAPVGGEELESTLLSLRTQLASAASGLAGAAAAAGTGNVTDPAYYATRLLEDGDAPKCKLLSGAFADFVQLSLAVVGIGGLLVKRFQETPMRPWNIWSMDVSKQCLGSLYAHFLNMLLAMGLSSFAGGGDECAWYFINYLVDSSLGVILCLIFIKLLECWAKWQPAGSWPRMYIAESGNYGSPPLWRVWYWQMMIWLGVVSASKFGLFFFLLGFNGKFSSWGRFLFKPLANHPKAELVIVMVLVPGCLNVVQFWILDNLLKSSGNETPSGPLSPSKHFKVSYEPILEGSGGSALGGANGRRRQSQSSSQDHSWFNAMTWNWGNTAHGGGPGQGLDAAARLEQGNTQQAFYRPPVQPLSSSQSQPPQQLRAGMEEKSGGNSRDDKRRGGDGGIDRHYQLPAWMTSTSGLASHRPYEDDDGDSGAMA